MTRNILRCILAFALGAGAVLPAQADRLPGAAGRASLASEWVTNRHAATRLVSAQAAVGPDDTRILLGFQVDLQPGWKTYWRSPGEAGEPPRWHWDKATNVADATVAWPLPRRSSLFGVESMVYEHQVVMPITLRLRHPGQAVAVDLMVDYFVCENICVPLQGRYRLDIPARGVAPQPTREAALIAAYVKRVPAQGGAVKISGLRLAMSGENAFIHFDATSDRPLNKADVFVEGPRDLGFGLPRRVDGKSATRAHFEVPVYGDGLNLADVLARSPLVLTLSDGDGNAAEYRVTIK